MRHELHLTVAGLKVAGPLALASVAVGAALGGGRMAASAALGAALVIANHLLAATSTGWARAVTPNVLAAGYAFFVVRMFAVFAAFAALAQLPWVHGPMLAIAFCVVLVASLAAECVSYARGSYVPNWRART